jgi:gliding motility-associated protein GldM
MSLPKEPRQKMINIMYLVLTALLALNVSKQILNAFVIVNDGLEHTNKNFDKKNESTYNQFDKAMANDRAKTKPYYDKAQLVKKWSKGLCDYIDSVKKELIAVTDGKSPKVADTIKLMEVDAKDNFDIPTHILINDAAAEDGSKGRAHELKNRIAHFRHDVMALCKPQDTASLNIGLKTPDVFSLEEDRKVNWEINNFSERPLAADIVMMTKYQNDVKNTEATVVTYLLNSVSAADFKFDELVSEVVAPSSYITLGDSFRAQLFVSAFSSTQKPKILVGDVDTLTGKVLGKADSVKVSNGIGWYAVRTDHEGSVKFAGVINVKAPDGSIKAYPFHSSYLVAKPAVVISPTKMNVFYISVDNPVEISAPGVPDESLRPSFQGPGSLSGSKGKYTVRVNSGAGTTCHIAVSATMADGTKRNFPPQEFRIKKVPDPVCYVVNQKGDIYVSKAQLAAAQTVQARLENFDFDIKYNVTSFEMVASANGLTKTYKSSGPNFTPEMKSIMAQLNHGSHLIIQEVHCQGPDTRKISGVNITIQ